MCFLFPFLLGCLVNRVETAVIFVETQGAGALRRFESLVCWFVKASVAECDAHLLLLFERSLGLQLGRVERVHPDVSWLDERLAS